MTDPHDAAAIVFFTADRRVLLSKRDPDASDYPGFWNLIGGWIEGETEAADPRIAALREVDEEIAGLKLAASDVEQLCCVRTESRGKTATTHYYLVPLHQRTFHGLALKMEGDGLGFFSWDQLNFLPVRPEARLALAKFFQDHRYSVLPPTECHLT